MAVCKLIKSSLRIESDKGSYFTNGRPETGWWTYYFENDIYFPEYRQFDRTINIEPTKGAAKLTHLGNAMPRQQAHQLTRLLKLRPDVLNMIDSFACDNFSGNQIIGIHYRGTDKVRGRFSEAEHVSYTKIYDRLGDRLLSIDAQRSSDGLPIHHQTERAGVDFDCYKIGLEAIMDCFLLARTNLLIRTNSNLSKVSMYLNPRIPVIEM